MSSPRQRLRYVRIARERQDREMRATANALHLAVKEAAEAGVPKTEIAELAGVSRQTVYDILGGPQ